MEKQREEDEEEDGEEEGEVEAEPEEEEEGESGDLRQGVVSMDGDGGGGDAPNGEAEMKDGGDDDDGVECDPRGLISKSVFCHYIFIIQIVSIFSFNDIHDGHMIYSRFIIAIANDIGRNGQFR